MGLNEKLEQGTRPPDQIAEKILGTISRKKLQNLKISKDAYELEKTALQTFFTESYSPNDAVNQDQWQKIQSEIQRDFEYINDKKLKKKFSFDSNRLVLADQKKQNNFTNISDLTSVYENYLDTMKTSLNLKKHELEENFELLSEKLGDAYIIKK
jgi:hypothetical protein